MTQRLACLLVALTILVGGCAPKDVPYTDQRVVKPRLTVAGKTAADVVVRVQHIRSGRRTHVTNKIPRGATVLGSAESMATIDAPFYCSTTFGESRIELGGVVSQQGDDYSVTIDYAENAKLHNVGISVTRFMKLGETVNIGGVAPKETETTALMLTLEPPGN
jgi:hypothetical protein